MREVQGLSGKVRGSFLVNDANIPIRASVVPTSLSFIRPEIPVAFREFLPSELAEVAQRLPIPLSFACCLREDGEHCPGGLFI